MLLYDHFDTSSDISEGTPFILCVCVCVCVCVDLVHEATKTERNRIRFLFPFFPGSLCCLQWVNR